MYQKIDLNTIQLMNNITQTWGCENSFWAQRNISTPTLCSIHFFFLCTYLIISVNISHCSNGCITLEFNG